MTQRAVSVGFFVLFAAFLTWYLRELDYTVLHGIEPMWEIAASATLLAVISRYWGVLVWLTTLHQLGAKVRKEWRVFAAVYAKSWLGRYLPGKVAWIAGKVYFASARGVSKRKLAVSALIEGGAQTLVALALSLLILGWAPETSRVAPSLRAAATLGAVVIAGGLIPSVFNRLTGWVHLKVRGLTLPAEDHAEPAMVIRAIVLYSIGYFLSGLSYFLITRSIYPDIGMADILYLIAVFNFAGAVGILSIFTPSGLGVREGVQMLMLPLVMPAEIAFAVTVAARLWSVGVDLLFYCVAAATARSMDDDAVVPV